MPPPRPRAASVIEREPLAPSASTPSRAPRRVQPALPLALALGLVLLGAVLAAVVSPAAAVLAAAGLVALVLDAAFGRPSRVLGLLPARPTRAAAEPRLFNLLEGLCVTNGLAMPEVRLLEDSAANAVTLAGPGGSSILVLTRGLLDALDRIALEGALAHELAMDKLGAVRTQARLRFGLGALRWLPPAQARLAWRLGDPSRLVAADRLAAGMTRYPPGLHACLAQLGGAETVPSCLSPEAVRLTGGDWLVPLIEPPAARRFEFDLELRIAALAEL